MKKDVKYVRGPGVLFREGWRGYSTMNVLYRSSEGLKPPGPRYFQCTCKLSALGTWGMGSKSSFLSFQNITQHCAAFSKKKKAGAKSLGFLRWKRPAPGPSRCWTNTVAFPLAHRIFLWIQEMHPLMFSTKKNPSKFIRQQCQKRRPTIPRGPSTHLVRN